MKGKDWEIKAIRGLVTVALRVVEETEDFRGYAHWEAVHITADEWRELVSEIGWYTDREPDSDWSNWKDLKEISRLRAENTKLKQALMSHVELVHAIEGHDHRDNVFACRADVCRKTLELIGEEEDGGEV